MIYEYSYAVKAGYPITPTKVDLTWNRDFGESSPDFWCPKDRKLEFLEEKEDNKSKTNRNFAN